MVNISHVVRKLVGEKPFLQEAMFRGIISYGALAEQMQKEVERELGKKVKIFSVVMALRRYAEGMKKLHAPPEIDFRSEVIMKTNLCDICVVKSPKLMNELKDLYTMADFGRGDTMNVSQGNYEISIVTNEKYMQRILSHLHGEKIIGAKKNLVSISLRFPSEFFETPGMMFEVIRRVAWENVNIYEAISTNTEFTLVIHKKDSMRAYKVLQSLTES
jgi:hypothetical protein